MCIYDEKLCIYGHAWLTFIGHNPAPSQRGDLLMKTPSGTGLPGLSEQHFINT